MIVTGPPGCRVMTGPGSAVCRGSRWLFQRGEALLEHGQSLPRPTQHRALHVELLARDEIELGELLLQHALEVLLEIATEGRDILGDRAGQAACNVVDESRIECHGFRREGYGATIVAARDASAVSGVYRCTMPPRRSTMVQRGSAA